jgi:F-type H+-transporting ATPase subunit b
MSALVQGLGISWPTLIAQIVNFGILFAILYFFAFKRVLKILDERSHKVRDSIAQTEMVRQQAAQAEEETRKKIEAASREGQAIVTRAVKAGEEIRAQAQQQARLDGETLINRAKGEIQQERDEAIGELRREFADLTITAAERVIEKTLDKKAHKELIEKTLDEISTSNKGK